MARSNRCFGLFLLVLAWARLGAAAETTAEKGIEKAVLEAHQEMTVQFGIDAVHEVEENHPLTPA